MSEPTKEELLARIAELEKKAEGRKRGALGTVPGHLVLRAVGAFAGRVERPARILGRKQAPAQAEGSMSSGGVP